MKKNDIKKENTEKVKKIAMQASHEAIAATKEIIDTFRIDIYSFVHTSPYTIALKAIREQEKFEYGHLEKTTADFNKTFYGNFPGTVKHNKPIFVIEYDFNGNVIDKYIALGAKTIIAKSSMDVTIKGINSLLNYSRKADRSHVKNYKKMTEEVRKNFDFNNCTSIEGRLFRFIFLEDLCKTEEINTAIENKSHALNKTFKEFIETNYADRIYKLDSNGEITKADVGDLFKDKENTILLSRPKPIEVKIYSASGQVVDRVVTLGKKSLVVYLNSHYKTSFKVSNAEYATSPWFVNRSGYSTRVPKRMKDKKIEFSLSSNGVEPSAKFILPDGQYATARNIEITQRYTDPVASNGAYLSAINRIINKYLQKE